MSKHSDKNTEMAPKDFSISQMILLFKRICSNVLTVGLLEFKGVSDSLITMLCVGIGIVILSLGLWVLLMLAIVVFFMSHGLGLLSAIGTVIILQLIVLIPLIMWVISCAKSLLFPATRAAIDAATE